MKRLTVYLKDVKKEIIDGKSIIRNTLSYIVKDESEAMNIVSELSNTASINKWQLCNIK